MGFSRLHSGCLVLSFCVRIFVVMWVVWDIRSSWLGSFFCKVWVVRVVVWVV